MQLQGIVNRNVSARLHFSVCFKLLDKKNPFFYILLFFLSWMSNFFHCCCLTHTSAVTELRKILQTRQKKKTKKRKYKNDLNKKAMCVEAMFPTNSAMIHQ